jgi:acetyl-CoA C-acetyltransferase
VSVGEVILAAGVRTPIGRIGGALRTVAAEDLAALVMRETIERSGISRDALDEVIFGQAKQSSDQPNVARLAALICDIPETVPAYTVHRQCGSGLQAVHSAVQAILASDAETVLAGGAESMSTAPYYLRSARFGYSAGNGEILDPNTESQPRSQPIARYGRLTMGMTAENLAVKYGISRSRQDEFACKSQKKAAAAIACGAFETELVPVPLPDKNGMRLFAGDEHPRATSLEELAKLKPVFKENGTVTAGNSSGRNDGAAAVLVASREKAQALGVRPMARIVSQAAVGVAPDYMGIGPVPAVHLALKRAGLTVKDIDLFEINEAFAAQTLAVIKELGIDEAILNVNGGAIALGHPIGCSGARILVTLLHEMARRECRYGCAALCIAGGMGIATIVERV